MSAEPASLIRMANQIAANYTYLPADEAATQVANHLTMFWAPSMREELEAWVRSAGGGLDPVTLAALDRLRTGP